MDCCFSETQFAFGIMRELTNRCWPTKKGWLPPGFPTQRQERDSGYDVRIEGPVRTLFFQFKVPQKITRSNGREWGIYDKIADFLLMRKDTYFILLADNE